LQYRDKALNYELGSGGGGPGMPSTSSSRGLAEEVARLTAERAAQAQEVVRLKEERAILMKKMLEQQKRLDEARTAADKDRAELAYKLGAASAGQALASGAAAATPLRASASATATATAAVRKGAGLKAGAGDGSELPNGDAAPPTLAAAPEPNGAAAAGEGAAKPSSSPSAAPAAAPAAAAAAPSPTTASTETANAAQAATSALMAKQEQLRQQEMQLLTLRQHQAQQRILAMQQARQQAVLAQQQQAAAQHQQVAQWGGGMGGRPAPMVSPSLRLGGQQQQQPGVGPYGAGRPVSQFMPNGGMSMGSPSMAGHPTHLRSQALRPYAINTPSGMNMNMGAQYGVPPQQQQQQQYGMTPQQQQQGPYSGGGGGGSGYMDDGMDGGPDSPAPEYDSGPPDVLSPGGAPGAFSSTTPFFIPLITTGFQFLKWGTHRLALVVKRSNLTDPRSRPMQAGAAGRTASCCGWTSQTPPCRRSCGTTAT
jgi:hypothetical protein